MPTVAIIPVKSFRLGKLRLSESLDEMTRARLGRALADHVGTVATSAGLIPLIVSADPEVTTWAVSSGFPSVPDAGDGLNAAAHIGVAWVRESASRWIILHSDLPLLGTEDVRTLTLALDRGHSPLAPSSDGGTSALGGVGAVDFRFGVASFHRHLAAIPEPMIVSRPGLALDIDSPHDLQAALDHPDGQWLQAVLS